MSYTITNTLDTVEAGQQIVIAIGGERNRVFKPALVIARLANGSLKVETTDPRVGPSRWIVTKHRTHYAMGTGPVLVKHADDVA